MRFKAGQKFIDTLRGKRKKQKLVVTCEKEELMTSEKPLLTVFLLTYNHEDYICDTFESILMQKTKYPFIVKILEDCSTDETLRICKEYVSKYPQLFTLINQKQNTKCKHFRLAIESEIHTPYWCGIEGDDYYLSSNFFEKGLNFLEANGAYNMYCGDTILGRENQRKSLIQEAQTSYDKIGHEISLYNYIYLHVSARIYRNVFDFKSLKSYPLNDSYMYFLYLDRGKSYFEFEIVSYYRLTGKGVWSKISPAEQEQYHIKFYLTVNRFFKGKYANIFIKWLPQSFLKSHKLIWIIKKVFGARVAMALLSIIENKSRHLLDWEI